MHTVTLNSFYLVILIHFADSWVSRDVTGLRLSARKIRWRAGSELTGGKCRCVVQFTAVPIVLTERKKSDFFRVSNIVVHKGQKWEKLTEQRRKKWIKKLFAVGRSRIR
ncbi:hypothetical protein NL108_014621 [Boleophthalmus pectinirostris]|nr:hypothetical protein NL108_014621 [Boleophthalmus pectinirostris]